MNTVKSAKKAVFTSFDRALGEIADRVLSVHEANIPFVIVIDGRCGAGKTTLAEALSKKLGCQVIHCDDFFLPPEMRTPERLSAPGGNIHYERFKNEVTDKIKSGCDFTYGVFDCSETKITKRRLITAAPLYIIEGSYSLHPFFEGLGDLKIFADISDTLQIERIKERSGEGALAVFRDKWIPLENAYFDAFNIRDKVDVILQSGDPDK